MISHTGSYFGVPSVLVKPLNSWIKFRERYRGIPNALAFISAAITSSAIAAISGIFGCFAAMYLYDGGTIWGDDFAVLLGGLFAVGTFTFVLAFTWLQKLHHSVSSRTSLFAFYACLILPIAATVSFAGEMDDYYMFFVLGDWFAILLLGLLSVFLCRRWWQRSGSGL